MQIQEPYQSEGQPSSPFTNRFLTKGFLSGKNEWWMYLLGIISAFTGYLTFQLIMMIPIMSAANSKGIGMDEILKNPNILFNPDMIGMNRSIMLALMMGMFVFTFFFLWFALKFFHKKELTSVITSFSNIRWKRYLFSFSIWSVLIIIVTFVSYITSPQDMEIRFEPSKFIVLLIVAVIFVPIQTATEELIFRGYLMQGIGLIFKNGIFPLIITSVLFGLMHGSNPESKAHGLLIMMPYYILFGAFLGVLSLLDEGTELAMGIHCANNLISSLLITTKNSVLQTDAVFYTTTENPSGEFILWIGMAAITFFVLYKKYNLSNWKLLIR